MKTLSAIAALATAAILAAPAAAATTEVRVSITGKSATQVQSEIKTAAGAVCGDYDAACVDGAILNARRQLTQIHRARQTGAVAAQSVSVVRIALKGKTRDQIHAEIRAAAQTVCKVGQRSTVISYQACVADTVRNAKTQLQARVGEAA